MELFGAVIAIDVNVAAVTVSVKLLEVMELWLAVMCADPTPAPVAKPQRQWSPPTDCQRPMSPNR